MTPEQAAPSFEEIVNGQVAEEMKNRAADKVGEQLESVVDLLKQDVDAELTFREQLDSFGYDVTGDEIDLSGVSDPHLDATADYQLERYAQVLALKAEVRDAAMARRSIVNDRVDAWEVEELRKLDGSLAWITSKLELLFRGMTLTGKTKFKSLPHGKIGKKSVGERVEIVDKVAYKAWAVQVDWLNKADGVDAPELTVTVTEPVTTAPHANLKAYYAATGEITDGVKCGWRVVDAREDFEVKPS